MLARSAACSCDACLGLHSLILLGQSGGFTNSLTNVPCDSSTSLICKLFHPTACTSCAAFHCFTTRYSLAADTRCSLPALTFATVQNCTCTNPHFEQHACCIAVGSHTCMSCLSCYLAYASQEHKLLKEGVNRTQVDFVKPRSLTGIGMNCLSLVATIDFQGLALEHSQKSTPSGLGTPCPT